jgi:hypothetical protein
VPHPAPALLSNFAAHGFCHQPTAELLAHADPHRQIQRGGGGGAAAPLLKQIDKFVTLPLTIEDRRLELQMSDEIGAAPIQLLEPLDAVIAQIAEIQRPTLDGRVLPPQPHLGRPPFAKHRTEQSPLAQLPADAQLDRRISTSDLIAAASVVCGEFLGQADHRRIGDAHLSKSLQQRRGGGAAALQRPSLTADHQLEGLAEHLSQTLSRAVAEALIEPLSGDLTAAEPSRLAQL